MSPGREQKRATMNTLVLGLGNPILSDDAVGIKIAQRLEEEKPDIAVEQTNEAAIALLDLITGYDKLIIIDSVKTGQGKVGELYKFTLKDFSPNIDFPSSHGMDIATAFEVGKSLGCRMPRSVSIYAVEVQDNENFSEQCTPKVTERIPSLVEQIINEEKL
jgi:hydrogenase maturation protease